MHYIVYQLLHRLKMLKRIQLYCNILDYGLVAVKKRISQIFLVYRFEWGYIIFNRNMQKRCVNMHCIKIKCIQRQSNCQSNLVIKAWGAGQSQAVCICGCTKPILKASPHFCLHCKWLWTQNRRSGASLCNTFARSRSLCTCLLGLSRY